MRYSARYIFHILSIFLKLNKTNVLRPREHPEEARSAVSKDERYVQPCFETPAFGGLFSMRLTRAVSRQ